MAEGSRCSHREECAQSTEFQMEPGHAGCNQQMRRKCRGMQAATSRWDGNAMVKPQDSLRTKCWEGDFPGRPVVKNAPGNAGDMGSIPGPGRSSALKQERLPQ